jgi:RNA polymerase sigma-70 factor, ECF subfamily
LDPKPILAAVLAGDRGAFGEVIRLYQGPLFGFLGRMGFSQAVAEDLAQEAFLRAWQNLAQFDSGRAQFVTWLFAIARNLALTELGSTARRYEQSAEDGSPEHPSSDLLPVQKLEAEQQSALLQRALRQLSMNERSTLGLAYVQELDMTTIARLEHCSLGAVKTRLHRAKLRLRELLENDIENDNGGAA